MCVSCRYKKRAEEWFWDEITDNKKEVKVTSILFVVVVIVHNGILLQANNSNGKLPNIK